MTTGLAVAQQLRNTPDLAERDRGAAEAVAAGLRDAKAGNTRRAYSSAWQQFRTWAEADGHPALPAAPQAVALYLGHLASTGRSIATVQQARSAISHFHAAAGIQKGENPALHPVVAEAVKGWRNRAPAPRQAGALTADALARVREVLRLPRRGRSGRMESADTARRRAALDLAIIGVLADGGLRRSEAAALTWGDVELWADGTGRLIIRKGKNQVEPATVAVTAATATVACGISGLTMLTSPPPCSDWPERPWPTGCAPRRGPRAWATGSPDTAAASGWPGEWWQRERPTQRCSARAAGSTETWWPVTPGASRPGKPSSG